MNSNLYFLLFFVILISFYYNRNLLNPGDIRSCNNNYPRVVQKSPAATIQTIQEEKDDNV